MLGTMNMMNIVQWLTEPEAAEMLGIAVATLRRWRSKREGPPWYRMGHAVRYMKEDIDRFIEESRRE